MILNANALHIPLADQSVHCVVTSPPYWALRDYGVDGQLGLERTPEEYIANMVSVFREVWRVLRDDGTLWVNMGDSYVNQPSWGRDNGTSSLQGRKHSEVPHAMKDQLGRHARGAQDGLKPKDLVGIPWMLAFALRQPYEQVLIKDKVWRAWFAGIIDGEGCITSNEVTTSIESGRAVNPSYPIILQVRMSDRQALERIVEVTGISRVQDEHLSPSQIGTLQRAPSAWKTSGDNAMRLLAECYPYLTVKRSQALIAWNLQMLKDGVETKRGVPIPKENMEKRKLLYSIIRDLNQRREVDIPSWCREPEIDVEPGWYLRSDCIWSKPNPMPESVTDRPTKSHEYLFLLSKSPRYYFDQEAVKEERTSDNNSCGKNSRADVDRVPRGTLKQDLVGKGTYTGFNERWANNETTSRNIRTVWTIATQPTPYAHFATYPEKLVEPCIKAGTSERGVCAVCGAPWVRVVEKGLTAHDGETESAYQKGTTANRLAMLRQAARERGEEYHNERTTTGWRPTCTHDAPTVKAVVFDPFAGSGTTGRVALNLGRQFIGTELNYAYIRDIATRRMTVQLGIGGMV